jgi:hypothetical protein
MPVRRFMAYIGHCLMRAELVGGLGKPRPISVFIDCLDIGRCSAKLWGSGTSLQFRVLCSCVVGGVMERGEGPWREILKHAVSTIDEVVVNA